MHRGVLHPMRFKVFNDLAVSTENLEVGSPDLSRVATGRFVKAGHVLDATTRLAAKQEGPDVRCHTAICHPGTTSFGVAVQGSARNEPEGAGYEVQMIDLYREGRDPVQATKNGAAAFRMRPVSSPLSRRKAVDLHNEPRYGSSPATVSRSRVEGSGHGGPARVKSCCRFA